MTKLIRSIIGADLIALFSCSPYIKKDVLILDYKGEKYLCGSATFLMRK